MRKSFFYIVILGLLVVNLDINPAVQAQEGQEFWTQPINLSHSGAASQPRLLAGLDGILQAFWIDRFDGMVTALNNGTAWSLPALAQSVTSGFGQTPGKISAMPTLFVDPSGRIHAFQYGEKNRLTGESPLLYSQMTIGSTIWPVFQQVAESAQVFDIALGADNELKLAYLRTMKSTSAFATQGSEPGVYLRSTLSAGTAWRNAVTVHESIYYRISPTERATLRMAQSGAVLALVWKEARLGDWLAAESFDNGNTWLEPQPLKLYGGQPQDPWLAALPGGGMLRIWQDASQPGCVLYQQQLSNIQPEPAPTETPSAEATAASTTPEPSSQWSPPGLILEGLETCPSANRFFIDNQTLYWVWGEGSPALHLSAWEAGEGRWSSPQTLSFNFQDPETDRYVQLSDLHAFLISDKLSVIGADEAMGEVWFTQAQTSALELVFAPPPPWSHPLQLSSESENVYDPALAFDSQGIAHIIWSEGSGGTGLSLHYARIDGQEITTNAQIVKALEGEFVRQPDLSIDSQDRLHLVWSGGQQGQVYYSRAIADRAGSSSGWLPAKQLENTSNATGPQVALSADDRLVVAYTVPYNENRGLYVAVSLDGGDTWEAPELVFNAAAAEWQGIDHLTLKIDGDGAIHTCFTRLSLSGVLTTDGIYYTRSTSQLSSGKPSEDEWIPPYEIAPAGSNWPQLALAGGQLHLLFTSASGLEQRWVQLQEMTPEGLGWSGSGRVPGWGDLHPSNTPTFALASDASTLHLVSAPPGSATIRYSAWVTSPDNPTSGRWSQAETYNPAGRWTNIGYSAAASQISGSNLGIIWLAQAAEATDSPGPPAIYYSRRAIGEVAPPPPPAPLPTEESSPLPTLEPIPTPTATIVFERDASPPQEGLSPMILGGALAGIVIIALFAAILLRKR